MKLRRVIVFCIDVPGLAEWYRRVTGMRIHTLEEGWAELDGDALHGGGRIRTGDSAHPLVVSAIADPKTRERWVARGGKLGPVRRFGKLHLCDGKDPEGNVIQISNR
jgi:hypothetical protein